MEPVLPQEIPNGAATEQLPSLAPRGGGARPGAPGVSWGPGDHPKVRLAGDRWTGLSQIY